MKYIKKIILLALILVLGVSISSCSKSTRNTVVPYGDLNLDEVVATAKDNISLTNSRLYSRLRTKGYDLVTEAIKKILYAKEITAITNLINSTSYASLSAEDKKTLAFNDDDTQTNEITEARYNQLKNDLTKEFSNSIIQSIFASTDTYTINSKTDEEIEICYTKYIESFARKNQTITKDILVNNISDDNGTTVIDITKLPSEIMSPLILSKAENFYAQKELYKIADQEYLNVGTDEEEKNSNYLFKESSIISNYDSTFKTYGSYNAIIITFNSRNEAMKTMQVLTEDINSTNVLDSYLKLYNAYYSCYGTQTADDVADKGNKLFNYVISEDENQLDEISDSVATLITDTLEDGEFLTEPRNLNNKYVLAYRISATFDYEEKDYEQLDEATKNTLEELIKINLVESSATSYVSTVFNDLIENSNLEIYDPLFEYKFNKAYTDYYTLIKNDNPNIGKNLIFKLGDKEYTVEQFYNDALSRYGANVITEYFQLEYAYLCVDDYVTEETNKSNTTTLEDAIKQFEKNNNSSYPKEVGLETFLLDSYGYPTKDLVLKYYYQASACLSSYKAQVLFDEWATADHKISQDAEKILNRILEIGNNNYSTLFNINVDHILINIDYDADGTPDDPDKFISEHPEQKEQFENDIVTLMQAIYTEAINDKYKDNTLYDTLSYIAKQYNKDAELVSQPAKTWADFKTNFNFLLTVEQLASSSDITQDSVSNFVVPFADYIKEMYKKADQTLADADDLSDNGNFFTPTDGILSTAADASKITKDTLCKTVYGYHFIVLNDFSGPETLKFTKDNDPNGYQEELQILISEDEDNEENNIYVTLDSYNTNATEASLNQLFIYYVQSKTGADSSLDSSISGLLSTLFNDAISMYSSSNFQTMVLLDLLDITSNNEQISNLVSTERNYYANLVISYKSDSEFIDWISPDMDWNRPNQK